jgi:hypothetical protein
MQLEGGSEKIVRQRDKGAVLPCGTRISRETHVANKFTDLVFEITVLKSTQKIVLWVLAHRADENGRCFPSYKNIARHAGVHKRTAALIIKELLTMEPSVLSLVENYDGRTRRSNSYQLSLKALEELAGMPPVGVGPSGRKTHDPVGLDSHQWAINPPPVGQEPAEHIIEHSRENTSDEGGGGGEGASPVSDSSEQKQETRVLCDQALTCLVHKFWSLLGEPDKYKNSSVLRHWALLVSPKVRLHSVEYVLGLMTYALEESEFWAPKFQNVRRCDPMQYLIEKFENIESAREGDEKTAEIRKRKCPTFGSNGRATVASGSASAAHAPAYRKEKIEW